MDTEPDTAPDTDLYAGNARAGDAPSRHGRAAATYGELKRRLLAGEFPLGYRMAEERLAEELGVSRTPVREALSRLSAEGLVERQLQGGYGPAAPDLHHTRDLYEVRFALELEALARPPRYGSTHAPAAVEELRADWLDLASSSPDELVGPDFVLVDEDFHVRLAAAAGNDALCDVLVRVNERIRPVRMHDFLTSERIERTIEQHVAILEAVAGRDLGIAGAQLLAHFTESLSVAEERAATALARMISRERRWAR
jgi:DNA-binding GntR family transcriptional regulator